MKNSIRHNGEGIQEYLGRNLKTRVPHPMYSPEASPSDFWFFAWDGRWDVKQSFIAGRVVTSACNALKEYQFIFISLIVFDR
jgi:hypothetical protein